MKFSFCIYSDHGNIFSDHGKPDDSFNGFNANCDAMVVGSKTINTGLTNRLFLFSRCINNYGILNHEFTCDQG